MLFIILFAPYLNPVSVFLACTYSTYHTILHSVVFLCKMLNSVSEGKTAGSWQEYQQLSWALNLLMRPKQLLFLQHCWKLVSIVYVGENIIPIFVKFYLKDNFVKNLVVRCRDLRMTKLAGFYWYYGVSVLLLQFSNFEKWPILLRKI